MTPESCDEWVPTVPVLENMLDVGLPGNWRPCDWHPAFRLKMWGVISFKKSIIWNKFHKKICCLQYLFLLTRCDVLYTLPETNIFAPTKMMVSKLGISFSRGPLFSGAFAVSFKEGTIHIPFWVQTELASLSPPGVSLTWNVTCKKLCYARL